MVTTSINSKSINKIWDMMVDSLYWVKLSRYAMFMHYEQHVTNWATRLTKSGPSWRAEEESSERHEVSFTRTFRHCKNVFPMISSGERTITVLLQFPPYTHTQRTGVQWFDGGCFWGLQLRSNREISSSAAVLKVPYCTTRCECD